MSVLMAKMEMLGCHLLGKIFQMLQNSHHQDLFQEPGIVLGAKAFKLTTTLMRSYPHEQAKADTEKAVYNYQHCLATRTCKNAFSILCQYFRIFFSPTAVDPETTVLIVLGGLHSLELLHGKMLSPS